MFIFPEGTRSYANGPELGAFKKGAFHLAVQAGVEIIPVIAANYAGVLNVGERKFRAGRIPVQGEFWRHEYFWKIPRGVAWQEEEETGDQVFTLTLLAIK